MTPDHLSDRKHNLLSFEEFKLALFATCLSVFEWKAISSYNLSRKIKKNVSDLKDYVGEF